jgi:hypothetical protein
VTALVARTRLSDLSIQLVTVSSFTLSCRWHSVVADELLTESSKKNVASPESIAIKPVLSPAAISETITDLSDDD